MKSKNAIDRLKPQKWAATSAVERLHLLDEVRAYMKMKSGLMSEALCTDAVSQMSTIVPMANIVTACIELYERLVHGEMPKPIFIAKVDDGFYDIHVFPQHTRDKLMYADRKDVLRVKASCGR